MVVIGSGNGWRLAISWSNLHLLSIGPLGINFSEIWLKVCEPFFQGNWLENVIIERGPFCSDLNVLTHWPLGNVNEILDK